MIIVVVPVAAIVGYLIGYAILWFLAFAFGTKVGRRVFIYLPLILAFVGAAAAYVAKTYVPQSRPEPIVKAAPSTRTDRSPAK